MKAPPRDLALVCALAWVPLLPFLDAAVSIDAPVFLAVSRQILAAPADPFGFEMIWDPTSPHVAQFNHNPPLLSYYLAVWLAIFGEREWVLHTSLLPFPLLLGLSFYGIAARLARPALGPTLLLLATPAFLVLASALLLDVPMLAWMLFAVYALLRSSQGGGARWELAAGVAAAAAGLTKYAGISTAPLLAAGLALLPSAAARAPGRAPQWARVLRVLGVPLLVWGLWGVYTHWLYGSAHFAGGLSLVGRRSFAPAAFWNQVSSVPVYYGCALLFPIAFLPRLRDPSARSRNAMGKSSAHP